MRVLSIDYGDSRTGFAISDSLGITAQGLDTLAEKNADAVITHILNLCKVYEVGQIVLGFPKNMDGSVGVRGKKTKQFAKKLSAASGISVKLWDERLTTVSAHNVLSEGNVRGEKRKKAVDKLAAVFILQGYLTYISK